MAPVSAERKPVRQADHQPSPKPSNTPSISIPANTSEIEQVLALQRLIGNHATQQLLQRAGWRDRRRAKKQAKQATKNKQHNDDLVGVQTGVAGKDLEPNLTDDKHKQLDSLVTAEGIVEGAETVATFKDELSLALGNFSSQNRTFSFDGIYQDWLSEQGLPPDTSLNELDAEQAQDLEKKEVAGGGLSVISKDADQRTNLGIGSGAAATVAVGAGGMAAFVSMVATLVQAAQTPGWTEKIFLGLEGGGQLGKTATLGAQTAASAGSTIAAGIGTTGNDTASAASSVMSGVSDSLGGMTPMIDVFLASVRTLGDLFKFSKEDLTKKEKQELGVGFAKTALNVGKAFLATARSTISAARTFLDIAGAAAAFTSVVPIIGAAINIVTQFIDMILQLIEVVIQAIRIHKGRMNSIRMRKMLEGAKNDAEKTALIKKVREINTKRIKRAVRPLVAASVSTIADVVSMSGSVLNVIGVATSPAYGAGVGIMAAGYALSAGAGITKIGASLSGSAAWGIRSSKQGLRDFAGNEKGKTSFLNTRAWVGDHLVDTEKTTSKKHAQDVATARRLFEMISKLKPLDATTEPDYKQAYEILKATGVDKQALFNANGKTEEQVALIIAAIKQRE